MRCFTLTQQDHIAHLVLNRPQALNAMHPTGKHFSGYLGDQAGDPLHAFRELT